MLAHDARRRTTRDLVRGLDDELLDLAAADGVPLRTIRGHGHPRAEMPRRRAARTDHGSDGHTPARVERPQGGCEDVEGTRHSLF